MSTRALSLRRDDDGIAWIAMDTPGESQNTLNSGLMPEFRALFQELLSSTPPTRGLVIHSTKPDSFIAGADIRMIDRVTSAADATDLSVAGQQAFDELENLPFPVVAAIDGACLGGGLELALACTARVASDRRTTALGLPEVQLGLLPGAGGTQRLPSLIGIAAALDLMLTGRHVRPDKARKLGLVDEVAPPPILLDKARAVLEKLIQGVRPSRPTPALSARAQSWLLEGNPVGQITLFTQARRKTQDQTLGNYPAADRIIDCVEAGVRRGRTAGLQLESTSFGHLVMSPESRALRHIFHAMTALKNSDTGAKGAVGVLPRRVVVLGAGLMGAGIATVTTQKAGLAVRFRERDNDGLQRGFKHVHDEIQRAVRRKRLTEGDAAPMLQRVTGTTTWSGMNGSDLFIEAVFEDLSLKQQLLRDVESLGNEKTIFATNTSSIPIHRIAEAATRPQNVIGMHYFSPVEKMPLLEIIITDRTSPQVVADCVALGRKQGKNVIVVRDGPGFYTSRILAPYMNEAAFLLSEGIAVDAIDRAARQWGFPVGPFTLLDEVGIDVAAKVAPIMVDAFGHRMSPPDTTGKLAADGRLGRKNRKGFYRYDPKSGKKLDVDTSVYDVLGIRPTRKMDPVSIGERLGLAMVNEAILCLQEGILLSAADGDIGAVFGLGFPPFRGGPFQFVDEMGAQIILDRMTALESIHGHRFAPADLLKQNAASRATFL
jgi:3-hydroxyacyl-CoA dehydrogenase/enoyl-CoA hydratase/3-hydroxybutyryl-CoA epimerase